jgi:chromosome segregation ATPase
MYMLASWKVLALFVPAATGLLSPATGVTERDLVQPPGPLTVCLSTAGQEAAAFEQCLEEHAQELEAIFDLPEDWLAQVHQTIASNPAWRDHYAGIPDQVEDRLDRRENARDRRENLIDRREDVRDRAEDRRDRREDRNDDVLDREDIFDRREDRRDLHEDRRDQRENRADRFENRWDRRENRWDRRNP